MKLHEIRDGAPLQYHLVNDLLDKGEPVRWWHRQLMTASTPLLGVSWEENPDRMVLAMPFDEKRYPENSRIHIAKYASDVVEKMRLEKKNDKWLLILDKLDLGIK